MRRWFPLSPSQFIDKRNRWTKNGKVTQNVRAYRGVATGIGENPRDRVFEYCGHAHNKMSAARKCGDALAARLNKGD
jgi:hypothetical protein